MSEIDSSERVLDIIRSVTEEKNININDSLIGNNSLIDSIKIANLIWSIEQEFDISFEDDFDMDYLDSIKNLIKRVNQKLNDI